MISTRRMGAHDVDRLRELDVSEEGDIVYKWVDGEVASATEGGRQTTSSTCLLHLPFGGWAADPSGRTP